MHHFFCFPAIRFPGVPDAKVTPKRKPGARPRVKRQNGGVNRLFDRVKRPQPRLEFGNAGFGNDDTHIEGDYNLPVMMQLSAPDQQFVLDFVKSSGSLKEMAQKLGLSYPTVRNRLDDIIAQLNQFEGDEQDS